MVQAVPQNDVAGNQIEVRDSRRHPFFLTEFLRKNRAERVRHGKRPVRRPVDLGGEVRQILKQAVEVIRKPAVQLLLQRLPLEELEDSRSLLKAHPVRSEARARKETVQLASDPFLRPDMRLRLRPKRPLPDGSGPVFLGNLGHDLKRGPAVIGKF